MDRLKLHLLKFNKSIIAVIHVGALPGTPKNLYSTEKIIEMAVEEALIFRDGGTDALLIENMHDRPYLNKTIGPEITSVMTAIACEIKAKIQLPSGIQILAGANKEALAVALAAGLEFIRAEGFVFGHLADEGWINSDAGELLRYRKQIGAGHIQILTDIKKKHSSHAATVDISPEETAKAAGFFLSDGIVVTGKTTAEKADIKEVQAVKKVTTLPVIIGSGIDQYNIKEYWNYADGFIIGSFFKKNGYWENAVDKKRVKQFMQQIHQLRT
jgi:membrane complex biogenesis BtpA family protein